MWIDTVKLYDSQPDGTREVVADLYADEAPGSFPTTGEDIEGLSGNDVLAKGSSIYVIGSASLYILNSQGNWVEQ